MGAASGLAIGTTDGLRYGVAPKPVTAGLGVEIGAGRVIPEVNFTLPSMRLDESTFGVARERYRSMVTRILTRAVELGQDAVVLEFEQLFEMTLYPRLGADICADIKGLMTEFHDRHGLKSALRATIADIRDQARPPRMRTSEQTATMLEAFDRCAAAGADMLSIESTGGKEVHDKGLVECDIDSIVYGLGVLGAADMAWLWDRISDIAARRGVVSAGDTACGFANTAMQLSHQHMIPGIVAAPVRLMAAVRSLIAVEHGAVGPLKDCGYENPVIKVIAGVPISMEGKTSACAHSSPMGNIAAAAADLWSNESVNDVRLLSGFGPEVFTEILIYDCRLMNLAAERGHGQLLRDLLVDSDQHLSPQAFVLSPAVVLGCAEVIVAAGPDPYQRTLAVARWSVELLDQAIAAGQVSLPAREERWRGLLRDAVAALPDEPEALRRRVDLMRGELYVPAEYGLS